MIRFFGEEVKVGLSLACETGDVWYLIPGLDHV